MHFYITTSIDFSLKALNKTIVINNTKELG